MADSLSTFSQGEVETFLQSKLPFSTASGDAILTWTLMLSPGIATFMFDGRIMSQATSAVLRKI
jgi:hypothetical protein